LENKKTPTAKTVGEKFYIIFLRYRMKTLYKTVIYFDLKPFKSS